MLTAFSIRTPLQGELFDFLQRNQFTSPTAVSMVRDFTCMLAGYREEDVPLFPQVFVVTTSDAADWLMAGVQHVKLGETDVNDNTAAKILKDAAALAQNGWSIYVAPASKANRVEYGVFRSRLHSLATSAEEMLISEGNLFPAILVRNRGHLVVELLSSKNDTFTATFSSASASPSGFAQQVTTFAEVASSDLAIEDQEKFRPYLSRLLNDTLLRCHGTLLAVHVAPASGRPPQSLNDGVWLHSPLDLATSHRTAVATNDASTLSTLQSIEHLLSGMISSDGVVVFGTHGTVLGFRIFLKPTAKEKKSLPEKGGGRRRTYALMKGRLGLELRAAFFRSQDGETDCDKADT